VVSALLLLFAVKRLINDNEGVYIRIINILVYNDKHGHILIYVNMIFCLILLYCGIGTAVVICYKTKNGHVDNTYKRLYVLHNFKHIE
jgi:hypothetical protein